MQVRYLICYKLMITGVRIEHTSSNSVNFKNNTKYPCQGTSSVWKSTDFEFFYAFLFNKSNNLFTLRCDFILFTKTIEICGDCNWKQSKRRRKKPPHLYSKSIILYICVFHFKNILGWGTHTKNVLREKMAHVFLVNVYKRNIFFIAV